MGTGVHQTGDRHARERFHTIGQIGALARPPITLAEPEGAHMTRYVASDGVSVKALVRGVLLEHGDLTDEALTDLLRLTIPDAVHTTVRKRRDDLVREGFVRDSGERRLTRAGRSATVWHAVADNEPTPAAPPAHLDLAPTATSLALQLWRSWGMPEQGLERSFWQTVEAVRVGLAYREDGAAAA